MTETTKHVKVTGRVQGVGFRYAMCAQAESLGVVGWVQNNSDGSVEAILQGSEENVAAAIEWARKGPSGARVEKVNVTEGVGRFTEFSISHGI